MLAIEMAVVSVKYHRNISGWWSWYQNTGATNYVVILKDDYETPVLKQSSYIAGAII